MSGEVALFDIEPEWVPISAPPYVETGTTKDERAASWKAWAKIWHRCIECGTTKKLNRGRSGGMICDDCGLIDGCESRARRPGNTQPGEHVSHWGERHTVEAHQAGVQSQHKRRAIYLRLVGSP